MTKKITQIKEITQDALNIKVTICIPTFNRPDLLKETLESCLAQTYKPFEIIIGDDSDTDATEVMIRSSYLKEKTCIRYYRHVPSLKQSNNMNFLFENAKGNKLLLIHDDDLLMPKALETLVCILIDDPTVKIAFGKSYVMDEHGVVNHSESHMNNSHFYKEAKYEGSVLTPMEAGIIQQFPNNGYLIDSELARSVPWRSITSLLIWGVVASMISDCAWV